MKILGIETSCDETAAAVVEDGVRILSNVVTTSLPLHAQTGGIIPEKAAREQIRYIMPVIDRALKDQKVDTIAVTVGPGLIGSLLVGVESAKTLSYIWKKPLVPVNHLIGHIYANWLHAVNIAFPAIALIVSGGHTDLVLLKDHTKLKWLGGTRDDASGEAFDKIGRLLNLPYPGGPAIEKMALDGDPEAFHFPRPMIDSSDFDFSFSGLKTAVLRETQIIQQLKNTAIADIAASVQQAIIDVLIKKTLRAARIYRARSILLSGGVAANQKLRDSFQSSISDLKSSIKFFVPEKNLCTDNGAMIAAAAFFHYKELPWQKVRANPGLYF